MLMTPSLRIYFIQDEIKQQVIFSQGADSLEERVRELEKKQGILETETKSAHKRIDKVENTLELLHDMNTNIKLIAEQNKVQNEKMDNLSIEVKSQGIEIKAIKEKPAEEWNKTKTTIKTIILTAVLVAILSNLDLLINMLGG